MRWYVIILDSVSCLGLDCNLPQEIYNSLVLGRRDSHEFMPRHFIFFRQFARMVLSSVRQAWSTHVPPGIEQRPFLSEMRSRSLS